jgi:RhoGEF domain
LRGSEKLKTLHRNRAVKEIFDSEAVYVKFLRLTLTFYRDPLRENCVRGITPAIVAQLFSDFESVFNVAMNLTAERKTFVDLFVVVVVVVVSGVGCKTRM